MKKNAPWIIIVIIIALLGVGLISSIWFQLYNSKDEKQKEPQSSAEIKIDMPTEPNQIAKLYTQYFVTKDFDPMTQSFILSADMKKAMNRLAIEAAYLQLTLMGGTCGELIDTWEEIGPDYTLIHIAYDYTKMDMEFKVSFNAKGELAGFFMIPYVPQTQTELPTDGVQQNITFGTKYPLEGELLLPNALDTTPIVILIQGSGPSDRNETIYTNQPFKNIAEGLLATGIGSFRYDKRTFVYGTQLPLTLTIEDEIIEDVHLAIDQIIEEVGESHPIYILGHSLGGYVAPAIALQNDSVRGVILLAAPAATLEDKILEQTKYLSNLKDGISQAEQQQIDGVAAQVDNIHKLVTTSQLESKDLLGIDKSYWLSLQLIKPLEQIQQLKVPVLVLQGENDYQVTMEDFAKWQAACKDQSQITFQSFPKLNHLFMVSKQPASPEDYQIKGSVADEVLETIAQWINK